MEQLTKISEFAKDTLKGLSSNSKYLLPKYFYDDKGSKIFQDIMKMPEYYLTESEREILIRNVKDFQKLFIDDNSPFELIELGSGDGYKTKVILKYLVNNKVRFNFVAIDISKKANEHLARILSNEIPLLNIHLKTGDYFEKMHDLNQNSDTRKVILFLGSNIGNFSDDELHNFLDQLSNLMRSGDQILIGFDLKKSKDIILNAYDDPHGHTRAFNMNHLVRINRELDADFDIESFRHVAQYNEHTGETKSFLVSNKKQTVYIAAFDKTIHFQKDEAIYMELSKKFDLETIHHLAQKYGFKIEKNFTDSRNYFVDSLWVKNRKL